jgi:hypothetical protein
MQAIADRPASSLRSIQILLALSVEKVFKVGLERSGVHHASGEEPLVECSV